MLTPQNARHLLFTTKFPPDKVIDVITGSFTAGASATTSFPVPHSFGVPLLPELIWSADGGATWYDQGVGIPDLSIPAAPVFDTVITSGYSTSSNHVIVTNNTTAGDKTILYVMALLWDDNRSQIITVPAVPAGGVDDTGFLFTTKHNLPKIYLQDPITPTVPVSGGPPVTYDPTPITHALGYVPNARVWFEPVAGQVWPLSGSMTSIFGRFYLTTTTLVVELANTSGSPHITPVYPRIYCDD